MWLPLMKCCIKRHGKCDKNNSGLRFGISRFHLQLSFLVEYALKTGFQPKPWVFERNIEFLGDIYIWGRGGSIDSYLIHIGLCAL